MIRCIDFYLLWLVMFCNIIPITTITSTYKQFGQKYISDDRFLSAVVTISSLFNCGGRIMWGSVADRFSFKYTFCSVVKLSLKTKVPLCVKLAIWSIVLITFPHLALFPETIIKILFPIWVFSLFTLFCGTLVLIPNATGTVFGAVNLAVNYGIIFLAFSFGSFTCAIFTTFITPDGAYVFQYTSCGVVCLVALFITLWIEDKKTPEKCRRCECFVKCCLKLRVKQPPNSPYELQALKT
ncbi:Oxalate:formate antiporter [Schistosoma japonicum]|nr:Oxalate:formate antiporter [Schistosoma japonicum]